MAPHCLAQPFSELCCGLELSLTIPSFLQFLASKVQMGTVFCRLFPTPASSLFVFPGPFPQCITCTSNPILGSVSQRTLTDRLGQAQFLSSLVLSISYRYLLKSHTYLSSEAAWFFKKCYAICTLSAFRLLLIFNPHTNEKKKSLSQKSA